MQGKAKKPKISQIRWNLKDIIKDEKEFISVVNRVRKLLKEFLLCRKTIKPSMSCSEFKRIILLSEKISEESSRLSAYASLLFHADLKSQEAMRLSSMIQELDLEISDKTRFFSHWIKGRKAHGIKTLDDKNAKRLFACLPVHESSLAHSRKAAQYTLAEKEEQIIQRKDQNGISVVSQLYDQIVSDFVFRLKVKGKSKRVESVQELMKFAYSQKQEERHAAYSALLKTFSKNKEKLYTIYSAIVKDWAEEAKLRGYSSPISVRNFSNQLPDSSVSSLIESCTGNSALFRDFFREKAKLLGKAKLSRSDIYAPVSIGKSKKARTYSFQEAKKIVLSTFRGFDEEFAEKAKGIIDSRHLDAFPRKNKIGGAFCASVTPKIKPYILLNHIGNSRDVSTLAHELGHGIHALYSSHLPISIMHASLPLCETASTLCELIVFEKLIKQASREEKIRLLSERLSDSYATILRQIYFVKFEIEAHEAISKKHISEKELSEIYLSLLREQFGNSIYIPGMFRHEWSYIPHIFHSPFYCYSYSFGELLSLSLFNEYKKSGKPALEKIRNLLSSGSSKSPQSILKGIGIDISKKSFWDSGFQPIKEWLSELKGLSQHG